MSGRYKFATTREARVSADTTMPIRVMTSGNKNLCLGLGFAGCALLGVAFFLNPTAALRAYLYGYCCVLAVPLGGLAIVLLQSLTGGGWGVVVRRPLEAATRTLPIMAILFLPIALVR